MMKNIINLIFAKNAKSSFVNASQSAEYVQKTRVQATDNSYQTQNSNNEFSSITLEGAYEVEEISLDDFKYTGPERRKFPRKPGETRSCYSKNNSAAQSAA